MRNDKVTSRYAKALIQLAVEQNILEQVYQDITLVLDVCQSNKEFSRMLLSPIIKSFKKEAVLSDIFKKNTHHLTLEFLLLITRKRREDLIEGIAEQFVNQYKEQKGIKRAVVKTCIKLDEKIKEKIIQALKKFTNSQIELVEVIDKKLIGGFILSFDNKQYDASIFNKLQLLTKTFKENIYESKIEKRN